jgi:hypothetical protein
VLRWHPLSPCAERLHAASISVEQKHPMVSKCLKLPSYVLGTVRL